MSEKPDITGHYNCPCKSCILSELFKLEQKKLYKEADLVISNGLRYYSATFKELDVERKKFRARIKQKSNASNMDTGSSILISEAHAQCQYLVHRTNVKPREFTCPIAIFDAIPDQNQKPMYPKNLVYLDGKDNQLEEIRAARYWSTVQSEGDKIPDNIKQIISSEQFVAFTKNKETGPLEPMKNPATDITNLIKPVSVPVIVIDRENNCDQTERENINPVTSSPKSTAPDDITRTPKNVKSTNVENNSVKPSLQVPEITFNKTAQSESKLLKSVQMRTRIPTSVDKHDSVSSSETSKNATDTNTHKTDTSSEKPNPVLSDKANSISQCENKFENVSTRSRVPVTASSKNPLPSSSLQNSKDVTNANVQYMSRLENKNSAVQMGSRIPCLKNISSNNERLRTGLSHEGRETQNLIPSSVSVVSKPCSSETFIVAKQNVPETVVTKASASETFIVKPEVTTIDKEIITLVNDDEEADDDFDEDCSTRAFRIVLPSSTPNKRKSQFFKPSDVNGTYVVAATTVPNLSMILEMSKERYSSSSGVTSIASQKTPFIAVEDTRKKEGSESIVHIADPFDPDLIKQLLQNMQFPRQEHRAGYNEMDCDIMQMKLSSTVKLGSNKFTICGEIGKGSYARILKLQDVKDPNKLVALKLQKPAFPWEFYISKEIQRRLDTDVKKTFFIQYSDIFLYRNGSVMMAEWAQYGSILNLVNNLKTSQYHKNRCPIEVVVWLSIQFVESIQYLHSCNIIHGDVKPDNFVLFDTISTDHPCIKLIDYGRSIDMNLLPKNAVFSKVVSTEDFTCNEMKDNRYWTYQTDLFGLAGTIYLLLVGEYMKTTKRPDGNWTITKNLPRYTNRDLWNPIFNCLLNVPSCGELPDLTVIRYTLEEYFNSLDGQTIAQQFANVKKIFRK